MTNWTKVSLVPSLSYDVISSTPLIPRAAASTRCVTCVSSSDGAAPGWFTITRTAGKLMSGLLLISICRKLTIPAISKALNTTSGKTGLRIDQAEILRKSTSVFLQALTSGLLKMRPDLLPWIEESPSGEHNFLPSCQALGDRHALARYLPDSDGPPFSLVLAIDDIDIIALFITLHCRFRQQWRLGRAAHYPDRSETAGDRKSTRLNSSHSFASPMPSSA